MHVPVHVLVLVLVTLTLTLTLALALLCLVEQRRRERTLPFRRDRRGWRRCHRRFRFCRCLSPIVAAAVVDCLCVTRSPSALLLSERTCGLRSETPPHIRPAQPGCI